MVISEEKRPLVTLCRKCRPPSFSVFISLSKSRAFPLRLGTLPAFGPAMIEEATACICNHKCIRGELKTYFLERAAPGLFFSPTWRRIAAADVWREFVLNTFTSSLIAESE